MTDHPIAPPGADAEKEPRARGGYVPGGEPAFGGLSPAEAARKRWSQDRPGKGNPQVADEDALIVPVPVRHRKIVTRLEAEAAKGDVQAARELRAWLAQYPPRDEALSVEELPRVVREQLLARLLREIEAESPAQD